ncbi:hypothetical protein M8C21_028257 [Ambrosia artemisiifolia]|uniref:Annexin n=1 Tax=Ambrosia artemisiifolia TaxID=4212 RepID=A0AAD5GN89_AMBAR|nr:hypothetical protein M8C21_028257 [Ambrosia artemisiifolia]
MATLTVPPVPVSPRDDAIQLHKAFKGLGCDTETVIGILAHRDATQRAYIRQEYEAMYSEDILKRLSSELSGKLETAVLLWMHDPAGRDAVILKQALTREFLNLEAVTEIICSRTSAQLQTLVQIYHSTFGSHLEHDIKHQASGDHEKILVACVSKPRYEGMEVDREMAAVKKETSGLFKTALLTILQCAENPAKYFAKVLHKSMAGLGTNDTTLIRVIVTRTEIDMQYIKAEYHKKYKKTLNDAVHSETSGHYRTFLLSLLGPNH